MSVMSSLRGLGAGITRMFTNANPSLMGSRAPSVTPPPSEVTTLTTNSMIAPAAPGAVGSLAGWGLLGGPPVVVPPAPGSSGGGSSAAPSVPPSPGVPTSVLGVVPAVLATRMRLLRSPVPTQPTGPAVVPPAAQEMSTGGALGALNAAADAGVQAAAAASAVQMPPTTAAAAAAHHHYRVAHMRTITEENLDLLLRPGSSGGLDLLSTPPPATPPSRAQREAQEAGSSSAAGGAGPAVVEDPAGQEQQSGRPRLPAELLTSTAEGGSDSSSCRGEGEVEGAGSDTGRLTPAATLSPFASCGELAGRIVQGGIAADADLAAAAAAALASGVGAAAAVAHAGDPPAAPQPPAPTPTPPGGRLSTTFAWPTAPSPVGLGPGPVSGAQVGAGDVVSAVVRHSQPVSPEDLRLHMATVRSPRVTNHSDGELAEGRIGWQVEPTGWCAWGCATV